jgi:hypothetical protein
MGKYIELQRVVYRVPEAVRVEWMYIYTFGSNEGNSHVHWLARYAVAAWSTLRGAAGRLDSLEQGCAQDTP